MSPWRKVDGKRRRRMRQISATVLTLCCTLGFVTTATSADKNPHTTIGLNVWTLEELDRAESTIDMDAAVVGIFRDFVNHPEFPTDIATDIHNRGAVPLIAWEPWDSYAADPQQLNITPARVVNGDFDELIDRWARQAAEFAAPVQLRFAPEMNGDWRPWSPGVGGTAAEYRDMWRYVVDRFRAQQAHNVEWVWNPYVEVGESTPMADLYPGDAYVDILALDGFNWGSVREWGWQSYDDIFASSVERFSEIAPDKPWMIAEVGCAPGQDKDDWVRDLFTRAHADGATSIVWFEFDKETDWRLSGDTDVVTTVQDLINTDNGITDAPQPNDPGNPSETSGMVYVPVEPARVYDSRQRGQALVAGEQRVVDLADGHDVTTGKMTVSDLVPEGANAVAYNVTVVHPSTGPGWLAVMPGDQIDVTSSTVNWSEPGTVIANGAITTVNDQRQVRIHNGSSGATHVVVDVVGYFAPPGTVGAAVWQVVDPQRIYDSRQSSGGPGVVHAGIANARRLDLSDHLPAGTTAVALNLTAVHTQDAGWLTAQPATVDHVTSSTLNWQSSRAIVANTQIVPVSDGGEILLITSSPTDVVVDLVGVFLPVEVHPTGARYFPLPPYRAYDSRSGQQNDGDITGHSPLDPGMSRTVHLGDSYRVGSTDQSATSILPADTQAVSYNVIAVNQQAGGWLAVTPHNAPDTTVSTVNWTSPHHVIANGSLSGISGSEVVVKNGSSGSADVVIDVTGYFR